MTFVLEKYEVVVFKKALVVPAIAHKGGIQLGFYSLNNIVGQGVGVGFPEIHQLIDIRMLIRLMFHSILIAILHVANIVAARDRTIRK